MKLTYDQIINILLLIIIIVLLINMSSRTSLKKLFNYCADKINQALNDEFKISLYSPENKSEKDDCFDGECHLIDKTIKKNKFENEVYNNPNFNIKTSDMKGSSNNESKENRKSSASFYYSENLEDKIAEQIYDFFEILITQPDYNITKLQKKFKSSEKQNKNLLKFIENKINSNSNFYFTDLTILNNVLYFSDDKMVEIQPIIILMNYHFIDISKKSNSSKLEGQIKIQVELFFKFDDPDTVFVSQSKFANKFGVFKISRISILEFNKKISNDSIDISIDNITKNTNELKKNKEKIIKKINYDSKKLNSNNKDFTYNLSDSNESIYSQNELLNEKSEENLKQKYIDNNENYTFQADNYSETINSLIPEKIIITDNSPQLYSN